MVYEVCIFLVAKSTRVNFVNQSKYDDLVIAPTNSSKGRWKSFTLKPGKAGQVTDSNGGAGNYDVEFTANFQHQKPKQDVLIGTFSFDNPNAWPSSVRALDRYTAFQMGYPYQSNGTKYYGMYSDPKAENWRNLGTGLIVGNINTNGLLRGTSSSYYSRMPYTAFIPNQPVANIAFTKDDTYKEWTFWASYDPNPGLFKP